jgi:hypothetical protein
MTIFKVKLGVREANKYYKLWYYRSLGMRIE